MNLNRVNAEERPGTGVSPRMTSRATSSDMAGSKAEALKCCVVISIRVINQWEFDSTASDCGCDMP
jgi:hypothetical protein